MVEAIVTMWLDRRGAISVSAAFVPMMQPSVLISSTRRVS